MPIGTEDLGERIPAREEIGSDVFRKNAINWIAMYGLALIVAISTFTAWFTLSISGAGAGVQGHVNGIGFPTGRLTLGIALITILAVFIADHRRTRGYVIFGSGIMLLTLSWYFGTDVAAANEFASELGAAQSGTLSVLPGGGLIVALIASLLMVIVGWRWSGNRIAERLPVLTSDGRVRNVIVVVVMILVLMEGANAVFGGASGIVGGLDSSAGQIVDGGTSSGGNSGSGGSDGASAAGGSGSGSSGAPATPASTPISTPTAARVSSDDLAVRIVYSGDWQGSVATDGSSGSVQGVGERVIDIPDDANVVSTNAQKRDDGAGQLTVQILQGNTVVAQQSTTAQYGVAQVSKTFF